MSDPPQRWLHGKVDRIGLRDTTLMFDDPDRHREDSRGIGDFDHPSAARRKLLAAIAQELHQHQEQIEEVEIKRERPQDGFLAGCRSIFAFDVNALDSLRVVCGEADEYD